MNNNSRLTESFYQDILRTYEEDNSIIINTVDTTPACEKGTNFVTVVHRVKVHGFKTFQGTLYEDYHKTFIVKTLPSEEQLHLYRCNIAAENESNSYNKIIPALNQHSVKALPVPNCIYADNEVAVLEDLAVKGFVSVPRANGGLTVEQCETVLKGLATIHAASFVLERKEPNKFAELSELTKELLYTGGDSQLLDYQIQYIDHAILLFKNSPISDQSRKCLEVLEDLRQNARFRIKNLLLNPKELSVICHGDPWLGNVMFNGNNDVRLLDLQLMRYHSVASDLSYFLYINLKPEVLFVNKDKLLKLYLSNLQASIKENGLNLDTILTEEWIGNEMSMFAEYGVICSLWVMPAFFIKNEDLDVSKERLSNTNLIADKAGRKCDDRLKKLILGYVRDLKY